MKEKNFIMNEKDKIKVIFLAEEFGHYEFANFFLNQIRK